MSLSGVPRTRVVFGNEGLGRQAAWRPECLGTTSSSMAGASAVHGELQVLRLCGECFWRTVKLLGGTHSPKGSRLIRDEMFFEEASIEVQSVMFGREAAWRPRYQCCVLTALQVMLVDREFAWRLIWQTSFSGTVRAAFVLP